MPYQQRLRHLQHVRFADDFVVACESATQAESALALVAQSLAEKGLAPKSRKTRIVSFTQGFHFLGYVFAGDLAVESKTGTQFVGDAALLAKHAEEVEPENPFDTTLALPPADEYGRLLIVQGQIKVLRLHQGRIDWSSAEEANRDTLPQALSSCAINSLSAVLLIGRHTLTTPLLHALLSAQVPVHFADYRARYLGATAPAVGNAQLQVWQAQQQAFSKPENALLWAKRLVAARLRHQQETLRQREKAAAPELEQLVYKLNSAENLAALNGFEGAAAAIYFTKLVELVPREFGFHGRKRRPPPDPFNALLSFGYTLLYAHTDVVLRALGFLPTVGFYHQGRGTHAALASDLMEVFRHIVERTALSMLRRKQLSWADFRKRGDGGVDILASARKRYVAELEHNFATPRKAVGDTVAKTLHQHLETMALHLKQALIHPDAFQPTRLR